MLDTGREVVQAGPMVLIRAGELRTNVSLVGMIGFPGVGSLGCELRRIFARSRLHQKNVPAASVRVLADHLTDSFRERADRASVSQSRPEILPASFEEFGAEELSKQHLSLEVGNEHDLTRQRERQGHIEG
jgi:hypothetical protein